MLYLILVSLIAILMILVEARNAPDVWICPRCQGEVIDFPVCMWCGQVKGRK